jgi:adenylosuccinate lyase
MPHKRNPILSENLTGLARMVRGYAQVAMENVPLWHERDISHSSAERMIGPDATVTLHFMLRRLRGLIAGLVVYPENMRRNLERSGGIYFSQRVLLALVEAGCSREEAYARVQRNAMQVFANGGWLPTELANDPQVGGVLGSQVVAELCNLGWYTRHARAIQARVFAAAR